MAYCRIANSNVVEELSKNWNLGSVLFVPTKMQCVKDEDGLLPRSEYTVYGKMDSFWKHIIYKYGKFDNFSTWKCQQLKIH